MLWSYRFALLLGYCIVGSGAGAQPVTVISNGFTTGSAGWSALGQSGALLTADIGSRGYDSAETGLTAVVGPSPRGRIIGWLEDSDQDLPYSAVGTGNYVRGKFAVFYRGPGDSKSDTLFNRVPNFRMGLRTRGLVSTSLDVQHNSDIAGSPAQGFVTRELGPSKNPAAPSLYRVDLDPVDVPFFTGSATEGIQRTFESLVSGADYSFVEGTLVLTESSIGIYPALSDAVAPVKVFDTAGVAGATDFDNSSVVLTRLGYSVSEIFRYVAGPNPADYFNPDILSFTVNTEPNTSMTRGGAGIVANTVGLDSGRIAVLDGALTGGVFGDTPSTRLRVEPGQIYRVSYRLRHGGNSDAAPYSRFSARVAGFGWNRTLELLGGRGVSIGSGGRPGLAQILPGTGNQVPGTTVDGTVYHLLFNTPLEPEIRADVAGSLAQKFPNLSTQPGPGDGTAGAGNPPGGSLRNVNFAFTVADSLSLGSGTQTDGAEVATDLTLNRIEVRSYADPEAVTVPLGISSNVTAAVHQTASQTLTFTFGSGVTGFDSSDISVTRAAKGAFQAVSASVYTLQVTGTGGLIGVSVPVGVAQSSGGVGNAGAQFSSFYQDTWTLNLPGNIPMELIRIPAGTFTMGSPSAELSRGTDENEHQVTLTKDFYIGKTEVTQAQWTALQPFPTAQEVLGSNLPVHVVGAPPARAWIDALAASLPGQGSFRLPTESEWEYAARAGTSTRFSFGNGFGTNEQCSAESSRIDNVWYCGNNGAVGTPTYGPKAVAQKPANPWGLFEMHGNVREWCSDRYGNYPSGSVIDPTGATEGDRVVARGGGWADNIGNLRSAKRTSEVGISPIAYTATIWSGLRLAATRTATLRITSNVSGSVHQSPTQTLTFTFGADVTGFDASDIIVSGAAKGTFTQVTPRTYTLAINHAGGAIRIEVRPDSASASSPLEGTDAATFSNFYQDTKTLNLPGGVPMELIRIPAGTFYMGGPPFTVVDYSRENDEVRHQVSIGQDFYLGKTEVTQAQWLAIQGSFPDGGQSHGTGAGNENRAVHRVTYDNIMDPTTGYMRRLNDHIRTTNQGPATATLPTESQWEYACRAGTETRFWFGNGYHPTFAGGEGCDLTAERTDNMWYCGNSGLATQLVGLKPANPWGLRDMHGNVWEWCSDWYGSYPTAPLNMDPSGPMFGTNRLIRGGGYNDTAAFTRAAQRYEFPPSGAQPNIGFRVLLSPAAPLTISSNVLDSVHQVATQTLTFTFGADVVGFDASDIVVSGATKGAFAQQSPSRYALEVTATGGLIRVEVSANAAAPSLPLQGTNGASFTNFYQNTRTITLPGNVPMELIRIPAGSFTMGSPTSELSRQSDETEHHVTLTKDFYLGKTEVTQAQWLAIAGSFPSGSQSHGTGPGNETRAVHLVTYNNIMDSSTGFMKLLNDHITATAQGSATATLPTESQWEYACRAGTTTRFNFGNGFGADEFCSAEPERTNNMWYCGNSGNVTQLVGQLPANAWGLRDMHGNVQEWCSDWYDAYPTGAVTDPIGPISGSNRVIRDGSYFANTRFCRAAIRTNLASGFLNTTVGFRVLLSVP